MGNFWDSLKETTTALGGAAVAPLGAVYDLAMAPIDSKDDSFGSVVAMLAKRGGQVAKPLVSPETLTGSTFLHVADAANTALREAVSEPLSTAFTMASHLDSSNVSGKNYLSELFSGDNWAKAYSIAQHQNAGQSFAFTFKDDGDPFEYKDPYGQFSKEHPGWAPTLSWGANIAGSWYLDPFILAGKAGSAARAYGAMGKLTAADKANLFSKVAQGSQTGLLKRNLASRTDNYLDWVGGKNALGRPLQGPEVLYGSPELRKYAAEPHVIAGLLADANKIGDIAARKTAQRRILAVAAGDTSQITRLRTEVSEAGHLADALSNMAKGGTLDLKLLAATPTLKHDPMFIHHLESQLHNLNDAKAVDNFVDGFATRLDLQLGTKSTMPNLPGAHSGGRRAVKRLNEIGFFRSGATAHHAVDDWVAKKMTQPSSSTVFQAGIHNVPLVTVKALGLAASPYTKAPVAISDALRQVHFVGHANLHDWGGATTQLDSMMKLSGVAPGERMKALSEAYLAHSEPEKMRHIDNIENLSMKALGEKHGVDRDYIETLMREHASKRGMTLAQLRGRVYAATEMPDEMMATRGLGMQAATDAASTQTKGLSATNKGKWRVDQINDDGTPLSLPLLETTLSNTVPLLDMGMARTLLARDQSYMSRLSKAWKNDAKELDRLSQVKATGGKVLDDALEARRASMDWLVNAGQKAMRYWKFGVLFRLGYPIRVIMDDHWRIWTQMHAASFYGDNGREWLSNWKYNRYDRRVAGQRELHALKIRRENIIEQLKGDRMIAHPERRAELKSVQASARGHARSAASIRKQLEDMDTKRSLGIQVDGYADLKAKLVAAEQKAADRESYSTYLLEQLGDFGPEDLQRQLTAIEDEIAKGAKGHRPDKKTIGSADLQLPDGSVIPGAFGGVRGHASREAASSNATFQTQLTGVEDDMYAMGNQGAHRTIQPTEGGHALVWADVLNNQIRQSEVAMHFVKGGDVPEFVRWIKSPEQAELRKRLPHFAHDAEDWGGRVQALVHDYVPTEQLRKELLDGRTSAKRLERLFEDPATRPAVHGRVAADNLGTSERSLGIGAAMNKMYKFIGELPTDRLSRHPFFNSMYKQHAREAYEVKLAGLGKGHRFTATDLQDIEDTARKLALTDLKRTLFDISAHSHAAHVMRFVSPFFAAQQEVLARWWRIVGDDPSVVRRFQQAFDLPRHLGLVVNDETGELVKPGEGISSGHHILLQLPKAFGGPETDPALKGAKWSKWSVSESAFALVLPQNGLTNPGIGPIVEVPLAYLSNKYADQPEIAATATIFNPYPPSSPMAALVPATVKRGLALATAKHVPVLGSTSIGQDEYNSAYAQNVQDAMVKFNLEHGREPTRQESQELMLRAGREANVDMTLRVLWNSLSPAPASPSSDYSVVQHAWYQISAQARTEGKDYDWAYTQFKAKWGDAYMPLVYSSAKNPAHVESTPGTVAALKRYRGVLDRIDPNLSRMVIGKYTDDLEQADPAMAEFSGEARNYLRDQQIQPGSDSNYYSFTDPRDAMEEQMARRGWQKYGELTGSLTAQAQQMGLSSYDESDQLVALKRAGVAQLRSENWAFDKAYGSFDSTQYNRYLDDMRTITKSPSLASDPVRTDVQTLKSYLTLRDFFVKVLAAREAAGLGGAEAQAQNGVRAVYTALVGKLVESNTYFETNMYNGSIERDPLLLGAN